MEGKGTKGREGEEREGRKGDEGRNESLHLSQEIWQWPLTSPSPPA